MRDLLSERLCFLIPCFLMDQVDFVRMNVLPGEVKED